MELNNNIDNEWEKFISSTYDDDDISCDEESSNEIIQQTQEDFLSANLSADINSTAPKSSDIYISTKTKIAYLNNPIDLKMMFWKIPIIPYSKPEPGIIKKQMKFNTDTRDELQNIQDKIDKDAYVEEHIITHIDNPSGRIKFKDTRKISIGISKKDILSYRCKKKSAFYNCFVLIIRLKIDETFKEFHVKVFNTGKLEIPGIQSEKSFNILLDKVLQILQPYIEPKLEYNKNTNETVLINSNFNCGFFINREKLYEILKFKYNIQSIYDPCSYPGIQCKFYYNPEVLLQNGCQISEENKKIYKNVKGVSFMIFRTGSVLIVGRCDEDVLFIIYDYLKIILNNEYKNICQKTSKNEQDNKGIVKKKKTRRKNITIEIDNKLYL